MNGFTDIILFDLTLVSRFRDRLTIYPVKILNRNSRNNTNIGVPLVWATQQLKP